MGSRHHAQGSRNRRRRRSGRLGRGQRRKWPSRQNHGHGRRPSPGRRPQRSRRCSINSFPPGTLVLLANGTAKLIEKVKVGDKVTSTDPKTGKTEAKDVVGAYGGTNYTGLYQITITGEHGKPGVIFATEHHPFWDPAHHTWTRADNLKPGTKLRTPTGTPAKVLTTHKTPTHPRVHDLTIATTHTFYVLAHNTPVLVHNCGEGEIPDKLYHYTNEAGHDGITSSQKLLPSLRAVNPKDARYGDGWYLTDIAPGTKSLGQLSAAFLRVPWAGRKFTHFIEIDVRGLNVVQGRPGVFVIPNDGPLDLVGRILNSGMN